MRNGAESPPTPSPRRWLQFRLRTVLVVITLAAVGMGYWTYKVRAIRRQHLAVEQVTAWQEKLSKQPDHWISDHPLVMEMQKLPWWLTLSGEQERPRVSAISFDVRSYDDGFEEPNQIDDAALRLIASMPQLKSLKVPRSKITDAGLSALVSQQELTYLDLSGTAVTDAGLKHVGRLRSLKVLLLDGTQVRGSGLVHLARCPLREIWLRATPLQTEHMHHLRGLKSLEQLVIESSSLTELQLDGLLNLSSVSAYLSAANVDLRLERLPALEQVAIRCSTANSLRSLKLSELAKLTQLDIGISELSAAADAEGSLALHDLPALLKVIVRLFDFR